MPKSYSFINRYFDHIYVVNLKKDIEKRYKITKHLLAFGIRFELFEATDGSKGDIAKRYEQYAQRPLGNLRYFKRFSRLERQQGRPFIESYGAMGYIHTYIRLLNDAKRKGYRRILILEDDIILSQTFHDDFRSFIRAINEEWKVLLLGATQYGWDSIDINEAKTRGYYHPVTLDIAHFTYGSFAIAIDHTIFDELIALQSHYESSFDYLPMWYLYRKYRHQCFVAYPNFVIPDVTNSMIRREKQQRSEAVKRRWFLNRFDYPLAKPSIHLFISHPLHIDNTLFSETARLPFELRCFSLYRKKWLPTHHKDPINDASPSDTLPPIPTAAQDADFLATVEPTVKHLAVDDFVEFLNARYHLPVSKKTALQNIEKIPRRKTYLFSIIVLVNDGSKLSQTIRSLLPTTNNDDLQLLLLNISSQSAVSTKLACSQKEFSSQTVQIVQSSDTDNVAKILNQAFMLQESEYLIILTEGDTLDPTLLPPLAKSLYASPSSTAGAILVSEDTPYANVTSSTLYEELVFHAPWKHTLPFGRMVVKTSALSDLHAFDETCPNLWAFKTQMFLLERFRFQPFYANGFEISTQLYDTYLLQALQSEHDCLRRLLDDKVSTFYRRYNRLKREQRRFLKIKSAIGRMASVSLLKHPFKKIASYKKLMQVYFFQGRRRVE